MRNENRPTQEGKEGAQANRIRPDPGGLGMRGILGREVLPIRIDDASMGRTKVARLAAMGWPTNV